MDEINQNENWFKLLIEVIDYEEYEQQFKSRETSIKEFKSEISKKT